MKRLPNLDVLRFVLIVYVIMIHLAQLSKNQGLPNLNYLFENHKGNEAIDIFFVMSGFLIIRIIYKAKKKRNFSIMKFYMRRILKIFPLYYFIVFFGFTFYHALLPLLGVPYETNYNLSEGVLYYVFFLANVFSRSHDVGGILGILWSLAIEEQFYIIIAPFLFVIRNTRVLLGLFLLLLFSFLIFHIESWEWIRRFKMEFFFIFFGGLIAVLEENNKLNFLKISGWIPFIVTVLILLFFLTPWFDFETLWIYNLYITVLFGLFIHSIAINNHGVAVRTPILIYFGEITYGLYLYHIIVVNLVVFIFMKLNPSNLFNDTISLILMNLITFGLTIFISHLSYKYFETYFLNLKDKYR